MLKIKMSNLSIGTVVMRFYLMMAVAILLGFAGQWVLMAFVPGVIGASAIMGMSFEMGMPKNTKTKTRKIIQMNREADLKKAS